MTQHNREALKFNLKISNKNREASKNNFETQFGSYLNKWKLNQVEVLTEYLG